MSAMPPEHPRCRCVPPTSPTDFSKPRFKRPATLTAKLREEDRRAVADLLGETRKPDFSYIYVAAAWAE